MQPGFEKKMYSRKDNVAGKESDMSISLTGGGSPFSVPASLQLKQLTSTLLCFLFVYGRNKACVQFNEPDL